MKEIDEEEKVVGMPFLNMVMALAAPFFVWPVEMLLPYPHIVEEIVKLLLVAKPAKDGGGWLLGAGIGFLFALSETMLYVVNAIILGNFGVLGMRLLLTVPMHVLTTILIYLGVRKGGLGTMVGLGLGMGLHWTFNMWASGLALAN